MLSRPVGLLRLVLYLVGEITIKGRELHFGDFIRYTFMSVFAIYELIFFKLDMMVGTTKLYILVSVSTNDSPLSCFPQVKRLASKCKCQEYVNRISEGVYDVFGRRVFIRVRVALTS